MAEYIAYFDESGDHGLEKISAGFPVFVLCGCLFRVSDYIHADAPSFSQIKFETFGHDAVVFHSREIRKRLGEFRILQDEARRLKFMDDVAAFFRGSRATIVAAAIDKRKLIDLYRTPGDPYEIALLFCLEGLKLCLTDSGAAPTSVMCVFEQRGAKEDAALAAEFGRIVNGATMLGPLPFRIVFASKLANMPGLQIADLAAYPIARRVIDPSNANPAFDAVQTRLRRSPEGKVDGWGLKIFP
ncbi:MAG: DUF3800 domain-containing protein [Parvularculaceae bacterium]